MQITKGFFVANLKHKVCCCYKQRTDLAVKFTATDTNMNCTRILFIYAFNLLIPSHSFLLKRRKLIAQTPHLLQDL